MKSEREKFKVARAESNSPRRSKEKDFIRRNCWVVGRRKLQDSLAIIIGNTLFIARKAFVNILKY